MLNRLRSWLFNASLILGLAVLGQFGRTFDSCAESSIRSLEHFAKGDSHALHYSSIARSLLTTSTLYVEKKHRQERRRRIESSSQLFGFLPRESQLSAPSLQGSPSTNVTSIQSKDSSNELDHSRPVNVDWPSPNVAGLDADFLADWGDNNVQFPGVTFQSGDATEDVFGATNLFSIFGDNESFDFPNIP